MKSIYLHIKKWFLNDLMNETSDFYIKARTELMFEFPFFTGLLLCVLSLTCLAFNIEHSVYSVTIGWVFCFVLLLILKYFKNLWLSSFIYCFGVSAILIGNLFLNSESMHLGYPYWIVLLILISTFNLGIRYGIILSVISGIAFIYYRQHLLRIGLEHEIVSPEKRLVQSIIEITLSTSLLLYVVYIYLLTSRKSEDALKETNDQLVTRNSLIETQSEEKTVMLREIHHRVKNNLQIINSILRLQSAELEDEKSLRVFDLSQKRILAMSYIHERLYMLDKIQNDISEDYIPLLMQDLINLYANNQQVSTEIKFENGFVNQKNVVPFGLIINELISNSMKHGIIETGEIKLTGIIENHCIKITYSDNGQGISDDFKKAFGMELIESLTDQLDGEMKYTTSKGIGTTFHFTFPITTECLK